MLSWQQRIDRAREPITTGWIFKKTVLRGFSEEDEDMALDWMTCSCGMLDARIPRVFEAVGRDPTKLGRPVDNELYCLGVKFHDAVRNDDIDRAEIIYRKVQARAEILIEQIEAKERQPVVEDPVTQPAGVSSIHNLPNDA